MMRIPDEERSEILERLRVSSVQEMDDTLLVDCKDCFKVHAVSDGCGVEPCDTYRNSTVEPIRKPTVNFKTTGSQRRCLASLMVALYWLKLDLTADTKLTIERCLDATIRELKRHSD